MTDQTQPADVDEQEMLIHIDLLKQSLLEEAEKAIDELVEHNEPLDAQATVPMDQLRALRALLAQYNSLKERERENSELTRRLAATVAHTEQLENELASLKAENTKLNEECLRWAEDAFDNSTAEPITPEEVEEIVKKCLKANPSVAARLAGEKP